MDPPARGARRADDHRRGRAPPRRANGRGHGHAPGRGAKGGPGRRARQPQRRRQGRRRDRRRAAARRHLRPHARGRAPRPRRRPQDARPSARHRGRDAPAHGPRARRAHGVDRGRAAPPGPVGRGNRPSAPPPARRDRDAHWLRQRLRGPLRVEAPPMLGGRTPAQEQWRAAGGDGRAGGRSVLGAVIGRSLVLSLFLASVGTAAVATAAERCADCVSAGAASHTLRVPPGTPLAGYGAMKRRLLFPDVFGRDPHAFWFKPSTGERDPLVARALVLEAGPTRLAWVALDLIAVDGTFMQALEGRLARAGVPRTTLVVSASHTHSGPGAFIDSAVMGFVAVDRFDPDVRDTLVESAVTAIQRADRARTPALAAAVTVTAPAVTVSRLGRAIDPEIVVLKLTALDGSPRALVWNFAIHGTMLSPANLRLSGDVMGLASARLEQKLGVPALFVNGAVGDVSPRRHGEAAMVDTAAALAAAVEDGWTRARPAPVTTLRVAERTVRLPAAAVSLERCFGAWVPSFFAIPLGSAMPRAVSLVAAALGETAWVAFPGELQTALGQAIKREAGARFAPVVVAGLSNEYLGYFMTPDDARAGTYVACAMVYRRTTGRCLTEAAIDLLRGLGGESRSAPAASACDAAGGSR